MRDSERNFKRNTTGPSNEGFARCESDERFHRKDIPMLLRKSSTELARRRPLRTGFYWGRDRAGSANQG